MRRCTLAIAAALLVLAPAAALAQCQVLDDFTTGPATRLSLRTPNTATLHLESGGMVGGTRLNLFQLAGNPFLQPGELDANNGGPYVLTMGVREFFRVDLVYGVSSSLTLNPLGLKPVGCDRFRVTFNAASQVLNFNLEPFQAPGFTPFLLGINLDPTPAAGNPFCVDFPFANFVTNAPGVPQDFAGKGIDLIDFIFQSGSANGANAFAITKIQTLDQATATTNPCMFVVPHP